MRMRSRCLMLLAATLFLIVGGLVVVDSSSADPAEFTEGSLFTDGACTAGNEVADSSATVVRTDNGLAMRISTNDLPPGAYTVWWVLSGGGISDGSLTVRATGGIVGENGIGYFAASLTVGDYFQDNTDGQPKNDSNVILNEGTFTDPHDVSVKLVVKHHGEVIPGTVNQQMHTVGGGCPPNTCTDVQWACGL